MQPEMTDIFFGSTSGLVKKIFPFMDFIGDHKIKKKQ